MLVNLGGVKVYEYGTVCWQLISYVGKVARYVTGRVGVLVISALQWRGGEESLSDSTPSAKCF